MLRPLQQPLPPLGEAPDADDQDDVAVQACAPPAIRSPRFVWPKQRKLKVLAEQPGSPTAAAADKPPGSPLTTAFGSPRSVAAAARQVHSVVVLSNAMAAPSSPVAAASRRKPLPLPKYLWVESAEHPEVEGHYVLREGHSLWQQEKSRAATSSTVQRSAANKRSWVIVAPADRSGSGGGPVLRSVQHSGVADTAIWAESCSWERVTTAEGDDGSATESWVPAPHTAVRRMAHGYPIGHSVTSSREIQSEGVTVPGGRAGTVVGVCPSDPNRLSVRFDGDVVRTQRADVCPPDGHQVHGFVVGQDVRARRPITVCGVERVAAGEAGVVRGPSTSRDAARLRVTFGASVGMQQSGETLNVLPSQLEDTNFRRNSRAPSPTGRSGLLAAARQAGARGCERTRVTLQRLPRRRGLDIMFEKAAQDAEARAARLVDDPPPAPQDGDTQGLLRRISVGVPTPLQTDSRSSRHWQREGCPCTVCILLATGGPPAGVPASSADGEKPQSESSMLEWLATLRQRWGHAARGSDLPVPSDTGIAAMLRAVAVVLRRIGSQLRPILQSQQQQSAALALLERRATGQDPPLCTSELHTTGWQLALLEQEPVDAIEFVIACAAITAEPPKPPALSDMLRGLLADSHDCSRLRQAPQELREKYQGCMRVVRPLISRVDALCEALRSWRPRRTAPVMRHNTVCCARRYRLGHAVVWPVPTSASATPDLERGLAAGRPGTHILVLSESAVLVDFASATPSDCEYLFPSGTVLDVESRVPEALLCKLAAWGSGAAAADCLVLQERPEAARQRPALELVELRARATRESRGFFNDLLKTFVEPAVKLLDGGTVRLFKHVDAFLQSEQTRALLLTGDGGTGKSTAALAVIAHLLDDDSPSAPVPIYVSLPKVEGVLGYDHAIAKYIERQLCGGETHHFLTHGLQKRPVVVILDALDEVPGAGEALQTGKPLVTRGGIDPGDWMQMKYIVAARSQFLLKHMLEPAHIVGNFRVSFMRAKPRLWVRMTPSGFRPEPSQRFLCQILRKEGLKVTVQWRAPESGGPPKRLGGVTLPRERAEHKEWWDGDGEPTQDGAVSEARVLGFDAASVRRYIGSVAAVEAEQLGKRLEHTHDLRAALSQVRCSRPLEAASLLHAAVQAESMGCVVVDVPPRGHSTQGMAPGPCPPMLDIARRCAPLAPIYRGDPERSPSPGAESMARRLVALDRRSEGAARATAPNLLGGGWAVSQRGAWCQLTLSGTDIGHAFPVGGVILRGGGPHLGPERSRPENFTVSCSVDGRVWESVYECSDSSLEKGDKVWAVFECFPGRQGVIREARPQTGGGRPRERLVIDDGDGLPTAVSANRVTKDLIGRGDPDVAVVHRFPKKWPACHVRVIPRSHSGALRIGLVVEEVGGQTPAGAMTLRDAREAFGGRAAEETLAAVERERERLQLSPDDVTPLLVAMAADCAASRAGSTSLHSRWLQCYIESSAPATPGATSRDATDRVLSFAKCLVSAMHDDGVLYGRAGDFLFRNLNGEPPQEARALVRRLPLLCEGGEWDDDSLFQWRHRDLVKHLLNEVVSDAISSQRHVSPYLRHIRFSGSPVSFRDVTVGDVVRLTPQGFAGRQPYFGTVVEKGADRVVMRWNGAEDGGPPTHVRRRRSSTDGLDGDDDEAANTEPMPRERQEGKDWWESQAKPLAAKVFDQVYRRAGAAANGLLCAAAAWNAEYVSLALDRGATPVCKDSVYRTPLHYAALCGSTTVVVELCKALTATAAPQSAAWRRRPRHAGGGGLDAMDRHKHTPLHCAVMESHCDCVVALLSFGCDPHSKDWHEETAVTLALAAANLRESLSGGGRDPVAAAAAARAGRGAGGQDRWSAEQRRALLVIAALHHFVTYPAVVLAAAAAATTAGRAAKGTTRARAHHGSPTPFSASN